MEAKPEDAPAVCIVDTDCEVDFFVPGSKSLSSEEPGAPATAPRAAAPAAVVPLEPGVPLELSVLEGATTYAAPWCPLGVVCLVGVCLVCAGCVPGVNGVCMAHRYLLYAYADLGLRSSACTREPICALQCVSGYMNAC
jgi:hypothetical protein